MYFCMYVCMYVCICMNVCMYSSGIVNIHLYNTIKIKNIDLDTTKTTKS